MIGWWMIINTYKSHNILSKRWKKQKKQLIVSSIICFFLLQFHFYIHHMIVVQKEKNEKRMKSAKKKKWKRKRRTVFSFFFHPLRPEVKISFLGCLIGWFSLVWFYLVEYDCLQKLHRFKNYWWEMFDQ